MVWDFSNSKYNEEECLYLVSLRQSISESVHNTHWTSRNRKSSAIIPATNLAKEAGTVNYLSDSITAEKIIERIADGYIHPL